jgi:uncharacterized membrane protein HdeD (DUF308 family)
VEVRIMSETITTGLFKGSGTALLIRGIAAVLFGILVLLWPGLTLLALVFLFGSYAIVDGVTGLWHYASAKDRRSVWQIVGGVISVAAGIIAMVWPGITALALALVIGSWALVLGVSQIAAAFDVRKTVSQWWLWLLTGIVTALFGLLVVVAPGAGILSLLGLVSAFAVVSGALLIASGIELRRRPQTVHRHRPA